VYENLKTFCALKKWPWSPAAAARSQAAPPPVDPPAVRRRAAVRTRIPAVRRPRRSHPRIHPPNLRRKRNNKRTPGMHREESQLLQRRKRNPRQLHRPPAKRWQIPQKAGFPATMTRRRTLRHQSRRTPAPWAVPRLQRQLQPRRPKGNPLHRPRFKAILHKLQL